MNFSNTSTEDLSTSYYQVMDEYSKLTADASILLDKMKSTRLTIEAITLELERRNGITSKESSSSTSGSSI